MLEIRLAGGKPYKEVNIMNKILEKLNKKILNIALFIIKKHMAKKTDMHIYTYKRKLDQLTPVIAYKARDITNVTSNKPLATNNFEHINSLIDYSNKIVIDVGAALGATVVPFSKKASVVYAFEPQQDNYLFLLDQIKIRQIDNIKTYNFAVSNFNGKADFYNRESHGIHSLGVHNKGKTLSSSQVPVIKLDDFWKENINEQIGLLKIDVEGFEPDVLEGASYLLENNKIDALIFEFSPRIHKLRGIDINAPIQILEKYNYALFTTDGKKFTFDKSNYPKICDLIAKPLIK
jgi:FkbM family methyltransferase